MKEQNYIHHYTNLESLALILKNRTIRLRPLTELDDKQEMMNQDIQNIGEFVFVSCWTKNKREDIFMWSMYAGFESGVRISMAINPFTRHDTPIPEFNKLHGFKSKIGEGETVEMPTFLNFRNMLSKGCYSPQAYDGNILTDIIYTDEQDLLNPKIDFSNDTHLNLNLGKIGRYKNRFWEPQKECRYMMTFLNMTPEAFSDNNKYAEMLNRLRNAQEKPPFSYYDLDIRDEAFKTMRITPSPKMSLGNKILLDLLIKEYNQDAEVVESELYGTI